MRQAAVSAALHAILVMAVATAVETRGVPGLEGRQAASTSDQLIPHIVFLAPESPRTGGGGGGGGNQQPGPIRRAQGVGSDKITLRTRKPLPLQVTAVPDRVEDVSPFPSILLDVEPLASGMLEQVGLPTGCTAGTDCLFTPSAGVTVTAALGATGGWSATATHAQLAGRTCAIFVSPATAVAPATVEGEPRCN